MTTAHPPALIDADTLRAALSAPNPPLVLDCSHELTDPKRGHDDFLVGHVPDALHASLDRDLSGPSPDASGKFMGRHPLPTRDAMAAWMGRLGITPDRRVVMYDRQGSPYAARAWWLFRWMGHAKAQVLDGGWAAWQAAGGAVAQGAATAPEHAGPAYPATAAAEVPTIDADRLQEVLSARLVIDARAPERFRGEVELLDAAAGHIPGALNRFFVHNLDSEGRFKPPEQLANEFSALIGERPVSSVVQQCGSGVTACHNLLAMYVAGLGMSTLYPGSWSEWSADPSRPVARG